MTSSGVSSADPIRCPISVRVPVKVVNPLATFPSLARSWVSKQGQIECGRSPTFEAKFERRAPASFETGLF